VTAILRSLRGAAVFVALSCCAAGCGTPAPEPEQRAVSAVPRSVVPLELRIPERWIQLEKSDSGPRRGVWKVGRVGNDTSDVEIQLLYFGTGAQGDRDKQWDGWMAEFDGDPKATAKRTSGSSPAGPYEAFEIEGSFKLDVGPKLRGRSAAQRILTDHALLGAVVRTPERGNWFLRMVGPRETIGTVRADFFAVLDGAR
jgi:hypothetical protein